MDTAVLQETRNLLNSLNEENAELKSHAEHLTQQWRDAVNELESERRRFAQLEHDSKQINSNLLKQLQTLQKDGKSSQSTQDILERRCHSMEIQLERLAEEKAAAEDRASALEKNLSEAISREEKERREKLQARSDADRYSAELQQKLSSEREKTVASERSLSTRCEELSIELTKQQDLVAVVKKQKESERNEYERTIRKLKEQLETANEAAARTRHAEAECTFAHEEVHAVAEHFYETLSDLHARTRAAEIDNAEMNNSISRITEKFRSIALAAAAQKKNSESIINFYATNYKELKSLLEATVAENNEIRNSVESRVASAVSEIEKRTREATLKKERAHQEELESRLADLDTRQRERDVLAEENDRLKEALHESHESEKQLRAFSEQLYSEVVAANKVASEASEKERSAKAELTTLEHRVAERVRKDLLVSFEQDKSKMIHDFNRARTEYELELTELRAQLEENAATVENAFRKIQNHQRSQSNNNNNSIHHHQNRNQSARSQSGSSTHHRRSASSSANPHSHPRSQQQHRHFNPAETYYYDSGRNIEEEEQEEEQDNGDSAVVSPQTPSFAQTAKKQQQQRSSSSSYSVEPAPDRASNYHHQQNQHHQSRSASAPHQHQQQQQQRNVVHRGTYQNQNQNQQQQQQRSASATTMGASQSYYLHHGQVVQDEEEYYDDDGVDYSYNNGNEKVEPSHSPARNAARLPPPASRGAHLLQKNNNNNNNSNQRHRRGEESSSPSGLRWNQS